MPGFTVETPIQPESATCCVGNPLRRRSEGPPWETDLWECPVCHCTLQTSLSAFVPRGMRIVTAISTANCDRNHSYDRSHSFDRDS